MLYASIAFFILALVAALFGFGLAADPEFARSAQLTTAALFSSSLLAFAIDRAWGAHVLRRQIREPTRELDLESADAFDLVRRRAHSR
jgi:uncharacterized membrane protein YtjA (UPF0391 family)